MRRSMTNIFFAAALLPVAAFGGNAGPSAADAAVRSLLADALDQTKKSGSRCQAIKALGAGRDEALLLSLAEAAADPDARVRACAALTAGETKNGLAADMLRANVKNYLASAGPEKNAAGNRLAAINSVWALGEIGGPAVMSDLAKFYRSSDDTLKINEVIAMGKQPGEAAAAYLKGVAASPAETEAVRAAAFEMLEETGQSASIPGLQPSRSAGIADGDMLFAGGLTGDITEWVSPDTPVGHAGIFAGVEIKNGRIYVLISDCVPNFFDPGGVRNKKAWKHFTHQFKYPYYGNRTTSPAPTAAQRRQIVALALELGEKGLKYDITHFSQKGPVEFDCVGYTEYIYETAAGLNPTDDSYETGFGWPLTPWEQFSSLAVNETPAPPHAAAAAFSATQGTPGPAAEVLKINFFGVAGKLPDLPAGSAPARAERPAP